MEKRRVTLHNWFNGPDEPGGRVFPHGDPLDYWTVTKMHARYLAPAVRPGPAPRRFDLRAYVVDLDGSEALHLPDLQEILLYQEPGGWWFLKQADEKYLKGIEQFRLE
ncbi:hypothetical protein ACIBHX_01920 [Nonomuraea sp. NPDC050536]|uniref:hypothetical protein n=1 Tax=Nonomuraea sp. NPDC050536 TaxID=3364366 RepID=UPI0037CB34AE